MCSKNEPEAFEIAAVRWPAHQKQGRLPRRAINVAVAVPPHSQATTIKSQKARAPIARGRKASIHITRGGATCETTIQKFCC